MGRISRGDCFLLRPLGGERGLPSMARSHFPQVGKVALAVERFNHAHTFNLYPPPLAVADRLVRYRIRDMEYG